MKTLKRVIGKHNVASDQGLHYLQTGFFIKNRKTAIRGDGKSLNRRQHGPE